AAPGLPGAVRGAVLPATHKRTGWKYLERGYRHVWWDAGTMLANLLALAAADDLEPRLYTAFVDADVNAVLGANGRDEYALALLALGGEDESRGGSSVPALVEAPGRSSPLAEAAHAASSLADRDDVRAWREPPAGEEPEPKLDRDALAQAIRRRRSVRAYADRPLPRDELAELLRWSEAPIPADAPPVVRQAVTVAAVEGLEPGIYDAELNLWAGCGERELREAAGFAAMEQEHPRDAAVNVFQVGDLDAIVERLGNRGYPRAQRQAGYPAARRHGP